MQSRFSFSLGLGVVYSLGSIVDCNSLEVSDGQPARSLVPRQAPGVVSSSEFLRRGRHGSVVAGDKVYIDGGEFSFLNNGTPIYQYSSTLLSIDLSQTWSNSTVTIHSIFKPDDVPNLVYPSLWYDDQEDVLYSGFAGRVSSFGDKPPPYPLSLWSFKPDRTGSGNWSKVIDSGSPVWDSITRPVQPMMAFGSGNAYVLGGVEDAQSAPSTVDLQKEVALPGLVHFNMTTKDLSNSTAFGYSSTGIAKKGAMHYVPSFGPEGLFVVMGGDDFFHHGSSSLTELGTISIFDPSSKEWFNQTTSGNIPPGRKEFCLAGIDSNNATHEIFMYAGWDGSLGAESVPFDEIFILTLPAFHWIKVDYPPQHPRHGVTCNAVGGSQIIAIGGLDTNSEPTAGNSTYTSPYNTSDPFTLGLAIFDMTKLTFVTQYTANAAPYVQPDEVKSYYATNPAIQYQSPKLASLLDTHHFTNTTTSSPTNSTSPPPLDSSSSHGVSTGGIVGGVLGGVVALVLLATLILFLVRRRKSPKVENPMYLEAPDTSNPRKGLQEMYVPLPEMDGNGQKKRTAELGGNSSHLPAELGGSLAMVELDGSHHSKD